MARLPKKKQLDVTSSSARDVFAALRGALSPQNATSIADISRRLNISNNKAYRAVATLERLDYLKRSSQSGSFTIGPAAERLVQQAFRRLNVRTFMLPYLRQIATSAEETAGLVIRIGWYSVRVANIESGKNVVARANRLGAAKILSGDSGGLAILSTLRPEDVKGLTAFAKAYGAQTDLTVSERSLNRALLTNCKKGFAAVTSDQLDSIAIPLLRGAPGASAALTIEGPASRAISLQRDPRLQSWLSIVAEAEATMHAATDRFVDPFGHIDPDTVHF